MDKRGVLMQCSCCYDLKDFRDGNVISKSSSQTNNIDNSLGIKRSRSLNDVTADITDDSALCMTQSHSEECIGKPINKRLQVNVSVVLCFSFN